MQRLKLYSHWLAFIILLGFALSLSACGQNVGKLTVIPRPTASNIPSAGPILVEVKAKCLGNEQMLYGGYSFDVPPVGSGMLQVEASYPSASNEWTVDFFNPDRTGNINVGATVIAIVYCLTNPNLAVGMTIQSHSVEFRTSGNTPVDCPVGSAVTGGGFQVSRIGELGTFNAGLVTSEPHMSNTGVPGWNIQVALPPDTTMKATVYALCATMQLISAPPVSVTEAASGGGTLETQSPSCPAGQALAGGGYNLSASQDIRDVYFDAVNIDFSAWAARVAYTSQVKMKTWATCVGVPA